MTDRRRDVRQLLTQLGLGPEPRTSEKTAPQLGAPREAASDSLAAFFDSVRRAPAPRTVAEVPPTLARGGEPAIAAPREITRPYAPAASAIPLPESSPALPAASTAPPTADSSGRLSGRAAAAPSALSPAAAEPAPLSAVFQRLLDAGQRHG